MSDTVKLVIEIPEEIYARCKEFKLWSYDAEILEGAVATSTPLSEVLAEKEHYDELREVRLEEVIEYCKTHDMALVAGELARELIIEKKNINNVLAEIKGKIAEEICLTDNPYTKETKYTIEHLRLLEILDTIGKAESED